MGSEQVFQPLSREDRITVVLYRAGIVISAVIIAVLTFLFKTAASGSGAAEVHPSADILAYGLYLSVGMSVFFIHLYLSRFKRFLMNLYFLSLGCLALLLFIGKGAISGVLAHEPYGPLLLLPLAGCLGFVTAKEAFCFKLFEGYFLAMIMPVYLLLASSGALSGRGAFYGMALIAVMLAVFTLRKVFMPIAYDIGDKSAYR